MSEQQDTQVDAMVGQLVTHQRCFAGMSVPDRQWVFAKTKTAIALICEAVKNREQKVVEQLFEYVTSFKVAGVKEFVAAKHYVVNTSEGARVRISYLGNNLQEHLLPKTERNIAQGELKLQKLRRRSIDLPRNAEEPGAIAGLGGLEKAETSLYEFFESLAHKQATGNLSWVVGYARDGNGDLWALRADGGGYGWYVEAYSVSSPPEWDAGGGFVSR